MISNYPIVTYAILGMVFSAILMTILGINQAIKVAQRRRRIIQTIKNSRDAWAPSETQNEEKPADLVHNLLDLFSRVGLRFTGDESSAYSHLRLRLLRAGIRAPKAAQMFWAARTWAPILFVLLFFGLRMYLPQLKLLSAPATAAGFIAAGIIGFYLPDFWLSLKAATRKTKITQDLPDALDLLVVCVDAGLGLDSAFNRVAQEMKLTSPELSDEFKLLNLELRAGKGRQEALRNLAARADIDSLTSLVTLMIQTETFGTSITKALRVFADSFRTKRFQKAEETAAKLPVKMLLPMVLFIFPTFMAVMVGPAAISIWENWLSK